jgi:hypothetical protein
MTVLAAFGVAFFVVLAAMTVGPPPRAATTELIVTNANTGLALDGFDPVAYFIDGKPVLGRGEFELTFAGTVWRFRNPGNRGAFEADPDMYMPRFGGYDPLGVARGVGVAGDPRLWIIRNSALYLFYTIEAHDAFADDADGIAALAERNWPAVKLTLSP